MKKIVSLAVLLGIGWVLWQMFRPKATALDAHLAEQKDNQARSKVSTKQGNLYRPLMTSLVDTLQGAVITPFSPDDPDAGLLNN